jgi:predicted DNA-binding antitoxin AbrB/MazE fold protein
MTHVTEAVYTHGVLKPAGPLDLHEQQRVRLIIQPLDGVDARERQAALARRRARAERMDFRLREPLRKRDEWHDCR